MKIKEVSATFAFTKNLGNYQNMRSEASIVTQVEEGENVDDVFREIFEKAKEEVRKQVKASEVR